LNTKPCIIFIQTAFIGDLFLSIPTLNRLKKQYSNHDIILICKKGLSEVFLKEKIVDHAFEIEKSNALSYGAVLQQLKSYKIDIVLCPHRSFRSAFFVAKINAKIKIGFKNWYNMFFYSQTVAYPKSWPDVIRQMSILTPIDDVLSAQISKTDWSYLNIKNESGFFNEIPEVFSFSKKSFLKQPKTIALFPGSVWKTKQWTTEGFSEVTRKLLDRQIQVYLMGGAAEIDLCKKIQTENPRVFNYSGKLSLYESYLKLKDCDLVICNDSAPAHMAASLGLRVIAIFGPTTLNFGFRPWSNYSAVAENTNINCRPCGAHGHDVCPLKHHRCMQDLKSDHVLRPIDLETAPERCP
jgi:heptosyltransferase-2